MRDVAIVQARMGSTRFPGKVLHKIAGKAIIDRVIDGLSNSNSLDDIIIATTISRDDDQLVRHLQQSHDDIKIFRGPVNDVLLRFHAAAESFTTDPETNIIRITADCPLINGAVIDRVIGLRERCNVPYASNVSPPTFPDGQDVEVFTLEALKIASANATLGSDREHVTPYMRRCFNTANLGNKDGDFSKIRLTVDYPDDATFIERLGLLLDLDSDLSCINLQIAMLQIGDGRMHERNEGYELSLKTDV
jgi:spore coat polysaccharide biosynthesis protein SpsF (cytidylyltransferase family)